MVLYNKERRLDARQILQHEYFSQDPNNLESIAQLLDNANLTLSCMCDPVEISGIFKPEDVPDYAKLWFDSKNVEYFEQFYRRLTGNETYTLSSIYRSEETKTREESKTMGSIVNTLTSTPLLGRPGFSTTHGFSVAQRD